MDWTFALEELHFSYVRSLSPTQGCGFMYFVAHQTEFKTSLTRLTCHHTAVSDH